MPPALTRAAAVIGPPVSAFLAASLLKDNGAKSTTLLPAGSLPAAKIRSVFACVIVCSHGNGKTQYGKKHDDDRTSQTGGERET